MTTTIKTTKTESHEFGTTLFLDVLADGKRVGDATVHKYRDKDYFGDIIEEYATLERVDISDDHQRKGYGTAAIKALAKKFGCLVAAPDNKDARRLCERIGMQVFDVEAEADAGYGVYMFICSDCL